MNTILKLEHIQKYYGNEGNITKAIKDISFSVEAGEFLGIMGASGSGKTTLLNCISTIDTVSAVVYQGFATPCYGIYPDNLAFGGTDGLNLTVDSYDADKAKEILADAGYQDTDGDGILDKDGVNLSFKVLTYSYNDNCIQLADMLQAELSQIGIELSIETQDVLDDPLASGDFDLAILNYAMAPIGTPSYFINMLFTTGASNNYGGYSNEKVDALAAEIGTTL